MQISLTCSLGAIIILGLIVGVVAIHSLAISQWGRTRSTQLIANTSYCSPALDTLVPIDITQPVCCFNNGFETGSYAVTTSSGLSFAVTPTAVYYATVCRELCSSGSTLSSTGEITCLNGDTLGQTRVNLCVTQLKPIECLAPAYPIATLGAVPYYASHATTSNGIPQCLPSSCTAPPF